MLLNIRPLREKSGLSQAAMAAHLRVNQKAVSQWERGENLPSCDKLPDLAKLFGCTIDELFASDNNQS